MEGHISKLQGSCVVQIGHGVIHPQYNGVVAYEVHQKETWAGEHQSAWSWASYCSAKGPAEVGYS